jgi:alpha-L-fucosidase 2
MALQRKSTLLNLLDVHPPFQIDGNFGVVLGITEMLMQSHEGEINILSALPKEWANGAIKGIIAR